MSGRKSYEIDSSIGDELRKYLDSGQRDHVRKIAFSLHCGDIIDFLTTASSEHRQQFISAIGKDLPSGVLSEAEDGLRDSLIEIMSPEDVAMIIKEMDEWDAVRFVSDLNEEDRDPIITFLPNRMKDMIYLSLTYPVESVGRLLQKSVVVIPRQYTVEQAINLLSTSKSLPEEVSQVFVVDEAMRPLGYALVSKLLRCPRDIPIVNVMKADMRTFCVDSKREDVASAFRKYGLTAAPVTDDAGRIIGALSSDDILEIMNEHVEEDLLQLSGLTENDLYAGIAGTVRSRLPWLAVNIIMASITSVVIGLFGHTIQKIVILAALMPVVASTGGNAGMQSVTVIIRGLIKKEITSVNMWRVIGKEMMSGMITGLCLSFFAFWAVWLISGSIIIAALFSISVIGVFTISSLIGSSVPLALNAFGIDPAVSSSIIVTTSTDITSYMLFLGLNTIFLT